MMQKIVNQVLYDFPEDLDQWLQLYGEKAEAGDELCSDAIIEFKSFVEEYNSYYSHLIASEAFDHKKVTRERLEGQFLQVINEYWAPLGEVAAQRQLKPYRPFLDSAMTQAQTYLTQLHQVRTFGVLVYFNKVASIKYYPYTNIAFLGIPYTKAVIEDWNAIPHEVGHYVYWNLGRNLSEVRKKHQQVKAEAANQIEQALHLPQPDIEVAKNMILAWVEEIYADIVGTKLAGDSFLESFKALVKDSAGCADDLCLDDGNHPPLCLRCYVRQFAHPNPAIDWEDFFKRLLQVENLGRLQLNAFPLSEQMRKMSTETLLAMFDTEGSAQEKLIPYVKFEVNQLLPAIKALVQHFGTQIDEIFLHGLPDRSQAPSGFQQLQAQAESDRIERPSQQGRQVYEILLEPRVLEGGDQHAHSAKAHGQLHYVGTHNH